MAPRSSEASPPLAKAATVVTSPLFSTSYVATPLAETVCQTPLAEPSA